MADRISDLPDDLLSLILSFLPITQVFTTTPLLSKRWTPLCHALPVLNFDDETFNEYGTFDRLCRFVDNLMLSPRYSTNKPLKTFCIKCWYGNLNQRGIINKRLASWLEAALQRGVKEFHLFLYYHTLNPIIFVSRTLVVLKLDTLHIANDTSCVDLPSLKTLHLKYVHFGNRNDYITFLSACPNLEDLHVEPICALSKINHDENNVPEEGLISLTLSKLVRASISSTDAMFNVIDNVECLNIITRANYQTASFKAILVFPNLIYINLCLDGSFHGWDDVAELLHYSPKLQILKIRKWGNNSSSKEWKCPTSVLECVSSHLRSCTISNFQGSENDLLFTKYILQNSSLLQDMKISINTHRMLLERSQILEELTSCPRISLGCKLSFE